MALLKGQSRKKSVIFFFLIAINLSPDKCRLQEHFYHNHLEPLSFLLFHQDTTFFPSVAAPPSKADYKVKCMQFLVLMWTIYTWRYKLYLTNN